MKIKLAPTNYNYLIVNVKLGVLLSLTKALCGMNPMCMLSKSLLFILHKSSSCMLVFAVVCIVL
jgi:hypothetical protein